MRGDRHIYTTDTIEYQPLVKKDMQGNYLENQQLQPDVEVYNTPEAQLSGEDTQLKRAVEVMLQTVK